MDGSRFTHCVLLLKELRCLIEGWRLRIEVVEVVSQRKGTFLEEGWKVDDG